MTSIEFAGDRQSLGDATRFVREAARAAGFGADDLNPVDLVVEEVFLNISLHGYPSSPGKVRIDCDSIARGTLTIVFRDWAAAFDPAAAPPSDLDTGLSDRQIGGLGLTLVTAMAESVGYRRLPDGNELTVRMRADRRGPLSF